MRHPVPYGSAALFLAAALIMSARPVGAAGNTIEATVVSTDGGAVVVRTASGEESRLMLDGVSVPLAELRAGDPVMIQYHPTDNGATPRVTMTRGSAPGGAASMDDQMRSELVGSGMIRLSNVQFDYDKATIRPDAFPSLDAVGRALTRYPGLRIRIDAYTDSTGTEEYNLDLSRRRAESVRSYLLKHYSQLESSQLTAEGHGEADPLLPNSSAENMAMNRRVEFVVLNREALQPPQ